jgi:tetratricopeptide (TPR) repeat protein
VRVGGERPGGILGPLISVDLIELAEPEARKALLEAGQRFLARLAGEEGRAKPSVAPPFPRPPVERPVSTPAPFPGVGTLRHLLRSRNPNFTGRDAELDAIAQACGRGERVALTGLGGVGKSQLATEFAHRHAPDYEIVWWLRAEEETTLVEDLALLAFALGLVSRDAPDLGEAAEAARRQLEQRSGWLLVFDNAPTAQALAPNLPESGGHVLVTSRNPAWRRIATPLEIRPLAVDDAASFLAERSGDPDRDGAAAALADALGRLPLALEQAAAYVEESETTLAAYLAVFLAHQADLLATGAPSDYPAPVATAWELCFQALERDAPAAAQLLELLAFFAPDEIPIRLFAERPDQLPDALASIVSRPIGVDTELVRPLLRYSLVEREGDDLSVHRLVQAVTRSRIGEERRRERAAEAVQLLEAAFDFDETRPSGWAWCARLLPHALAGAAHAEGLGVAGDGPSSLLNSAGLYLRTRARHAEARAAFEQALAIDEKTYGPNHPTIAVGSTTSASYSRTSATSPPPAPRTSGRSRSTRPPTGPTTRRSRPTSTTSASSLWTSATFLPPTTRSNGRSRSTRPPMGLTTPRSPSASTISAGHSWASATSRPPSPPLNERSRSTRPPTAPTTPLSAPASTTSAAHSGRSATSPAPAPPSSGRSRSPNGRSVATIRRA